MSSRRTVSLQPFSLENPPSLVESEAFSIGDTGYISVHCVVDDGDVQSAVDEGGDPVNGAVGIFRLYTSGDGAHYAPVLNADPELLKCKALGDARVNAIAALDASPSEYGKIVFEGNNGSGGNSRARIYVTVG